MASLLKKIEHIGIAVKSVNDTKQLFKKLFGIEPEFEEIVQDQLVRVLGIKIGETNLEYLEPTSEDSPIAKFLEKRGEGLHHIAISVSNIHEMLNKMKKAGVQLIDEEPRTGAGGKLIAFVHPKSMNGILVEFSQVQDEFQ